MKSIKALSGKSELVTRNSVEDFMKDYELEVLEENFGETIEDAIANQFSIEPEKEGLELISGNGIYDLSDDKDIEMRLKRDALWLNDSSSELDDLNSLESEAVSYFKNPLKVNYPVEKAVPESEYVTGYIQFNAGVKFTSSGEVEVTWKSYGQKLIVNVDMLLCPEDIIKYVEFFGIEYNPEIMRVCFYGLPLEKFVGSKQYNKGERKELVAHSDSYSNIFLAVPCMEECSRGDGSIYDVLDREISKEVMYGCEVNIDRVALGHWELTKARLEELKLEAVEEKESLRIQKLQRKSIERRNSYDENFKEARSIISGLNTSSVKVSDLITKTSKLLAQVVYLCEKKGERITNSAVYFQVKALTKKKRQADSMHLLEDKKALSVINDINNSKHVDIHLLDLLDLEGIFQILWSGVGLRISNEHKDKYFVLKERYQHLKSMNKQAA